MSLNVKTNKILIKTSKMDQTNMKYKTHKNIERCIFKPILINIQPKILI